MIEDVHTCTQQFLSWMSTLKNSRVYAVGDVYKMSVATLLALAK